MEKKGGGGLSKLSVEKLLSLRTLPKHFVEETFSAVFRKISESEKFYGKELGRGEYRKFPSIIFCLKMPKNFVGEYLVCH